MTAPALTLAAYLATDSGRALGAPERALLSDIVSVWPVAITEAVLERLAAVVERAKPETDLVDRLCDAYSARCHGASVEVVADLFATAMRAAAFTLLTKPQCDAWELLNYALFAGLRTRGENIGPIRTDAEEHEVLEAIMAALELPEQADDASDGETGDDPIDLADERLVDAWANCTLRAPTEARATMLVEAFAAGLGHLVEQRALARRLGAIFSGLPALLLGDAKRGETDHTVGVLEAMAEALVSDVEDGSDERHPFDALADAFHARIEGQPPGVQRSILIELHAAALEHKLAAGNFDAGHAFDDLLDQLRQSEGGQDGPALGMWRAMLAALEAMGDTPVASSGRLVPREGAAGTDD